MKIRPLLTGILICLLAGCGLAQEISGFWRWQNPRPQGNPLYAIRFRDERNGVAVGRDGTILHTHNGGQEWNTARSPVRTPLYGLASLGRKRGKAFAGGGELWIAVGARGAILHSRDDGATWSEQRLATKTILNAVDFVNEKRGWAVGLEGTILSTKDGGGKWQIQASGVQKTLSALAFADENHGVVVGADGTLLTTEDGGAT